MEVVRERAEAEGRSLKEELGLTDFMRSHYRMKLRSRTLKRKEREGRVW